MKLTAVLPTVLLILMVWPHTATTQALQKPEELAQRSAESWLALADVGKYDETWNEAAAYFKNAITKERWSDAMKSTRAPLGALLDRKLKSAKYTKTLPGAPDGEYVVIQFETSFERKKSAVETITPMLDKDGKWRVSGYFIK
ncbi:MAG TPA: DUF4019 domain-containing protein [Candidatus Sulfotelmatobacter sp.]|nr:DUF4019 domain-containing protein [Candidatus Sulfotelmatobacter sp.]